MAALDAVPLTSGTRVKYLLTFSHLPATKATPKPKAKRDIEADRTPSSNEPQVGSTSERPSAVARSSFSSGKDGSSSCLADAGVSSSAEFCTNGGQSSKNKASCRHESDLGTGGTSGRKIGGQFGGGSGTRGFSSGASSASAVKGFDAFSVTAAKWRSAIRHAKCGLVRISRIKGSARQREAADRVIQQIRKFLPGSLPECTSEDETGPACSSETARFEGVGFLHGELLGKIRWLRKFSRSRTDAVLPSSCHGLCDSGGLGWSAGAHGSDYDSSGTSLPGRRPMGPSISTDAFRGAFQSDLELQILDAPQPSSSFCASMPPELGNGGFGIHKGGGFLDEPQGRTDKEALAASTQSISAIPQEAGEGQKERRRIRRQRQRATRRDINAPMQCSSGRGRSSPTSTSSARASNLSAGTANFGRELVLNQTEALDEPRSQAVPRTATEAEFTQEGARIPAWVEGFVRRILQSKTRYSFFLQQSISQSRDGRSGHVSTTLFPIPIPFMEVWFSGPKRMNSDARHLKAVRKLVHVAVMALNYTHEQSPFHWLELLRRHPNRQHLGIYRRLGVLVKANVHSRRATIASCGRKSSQFIARLRELYATLQKFEVDVKSKYHQSAAGQEAPVDNSTAEELRPYRSLQADRLKIVGEGRWRCEDYLDDLLYMPFLEPMFNQFDVEPPACSIPDCTREDPAEIQKLAKVWDAKNLLVLVPQAIAPDHRFCTRVFNNYKNSLADRQIGDRRSQNFREGMITDGPSKMLPSGTSLLQIMPKRFVEVLRGSVTDRRDFYHQFAVPWERAITNCTFPFLRLGDLKGFQAYGICKSSFSVGRTKVSRDKEGESLGVTRTPWLVDDHSKVSAAFGALYQGDHLGVEFACSAHASLLQTGNLLQPRSRLVSVGPIINDQCVDGLVIDDYFVIARQNLADFGNPSASKQQLNVAKKIYSEQMILGSDDKDVWDECCFRVVGAEIDSRPELVKQGAINGGAPASKRLGIATVAASVATLPYTSDHWFPWQCSGAQ